MKDWLKPENCNKAMCKSCIFRTDGKALKLPIERIDEIKTYLATGTSSHQCHTTHKTCYGALNYTAEIFQRLGLIPLPTVESLLQTASKFLKFK